MSSEIMKAEEWNPVRCTLRRSLGLFGCHQFRETALASKSFVQRLELSCKLKFHDGCVNSLNFNDEGDLIASGSDDCNVAVWNWLQNTKSPQIWYDSGHNSNVFQVYISIIF